MLSLGSGYAAQEFGKVAPAPGLDWSGAPEEWLVNARAKGWIIKTAADDAKVGALIIGRQSGLWVGIVRAVDAGKVSYEILDNHGKLVVLSKDFASLKALLIGYIWPEKSSSSQ